MAGNKKSPINSNANRGFILNKVYFFTCSLPGMDNGNLLAVQTFLL